VRISRVVLGTCNIFNKQPLLGAPETHAMKKSRFLLLLILTTMLLATLPAQAQKFFSEAGYAEFESRAPALTFTGTSDNLTGLIDLAEGKVDFYLDLNTLDTGIRLRNRHMRDSYLETRRFPFAEFTGTLQPGFQPGLSEPQSVSVSGTFTIRGVSRQREIQGTLRPSPDGSTLELEAQFDVMLEDHDIPRPRVVFYELSDRQIVTIRVTMLRFDEP
jgi:polyisoprenoid-binding protein YceI